MSKSHIQAGQFNLKGKKYKLLRCRCCDCVDLRVKLLEKTLKKELEWTVSSVGRAGDS